LIGLSDGGGRVIVGNYGKGRRVGETSDLQGYLSVWQFSGKPDPAPAQEKQIPVLDKTRYWPVALAPVSSNGAANHLDKVATVVTIIRGVDPEFLLALSDIKTGKRDTYIELNKIQTKFCPVMAASPKGQWIAVACFRDCAIEIYRLEDLTTGNGKPSARLKTKATLFSQARFVRRKQEIGLWLSDDPDAKPQEGGMVFSFENRTLTKNNNGWDDDTPDKKWSGKFNPKESQFDLSPGGKDVTLKLEPSDIPNKGAGAFRPSNDQHKQALFALAHTNERSAETYITLFDAATGKKLRQFTGHLQSVRKLAFSDTLPLLVSVGEDQTVRVWSFADLNDGGGRLEGVVVEDQNGEDKKRRVVVQSVAPDCPAARAGLKKGDVIERVGVVDDKMMKDVLVEVTSAAAFDWMVSQKKSGQVIGVQVNNKRLDIGVDRAAGLELRRPLLSLFVSGKEWIAWSPAGPFDRSSEKADTFVGWHVNTGEPAKPVTFMPAGAYSEEFYKGDKGILKLLIEHGSLPKALDAIAAASRPAATLQARIDADNQERLDDWLVVRTPANLELAVNLNQDYQLDRQDTLKWTRRRLNAPGDKPVEGEIDLSNDEHLWAADLSKLPWHKGEYVIEVRFHSAKSNRDTFPKELKVRYQPPAPKLTAVVLKKNLAAGGDRTTVDVVQEKTEIAVEITVIPAPDQPVDVQFKGAKTEPTGRRVDKEITFTQQFVLQKGDNNIDITATNMEPLKGHEDDEASILRVKMRYQEPKKNKPPTITALSVTPQGTVAKDSRGDVLVVDQPKIKVSSTIKADNELTRIEWTPGDDEKTTIDPQKGKSFDLTKEVTLRENKPPTELRLSAATGGDASETTDVMLRVVYAPPLPEFTIAPPDPRDEFSNTANLHGVLKVPALSKEDYFKVFVKNKNGENEVKFTVDKMKGEWSATVTLARGENAIKALVRNQRRSGVTHELPKPLIYRQPPVFDKQTVNATFKEKGKPFASFSVKVYSPIDAKIVGAVLNEEPWQLNKFKVKETGAKGNLKEWEVTFDDVPAKIGGEWRKKLDLNVENADGFSRKSVTIVIEPTREDFPPPLVKWDTKREDFTQGLQYKIPPIHIKSDSKLKRVEVLRNGQTAYTAKLAMDQHELDDEQAKVTLEWGANQLQVVAINDDGGESRSDVVVVSATQAPVRVLIDYLEIKDADGRTSEELQPKKTAVDQVQFDELKQGAVYVHGHVEWAASNDEQLGGEKPLQLTAFVNGARQLPVSLATQQKGKRQRAFTALIGLPRAKNNVVEIELFSKVKTESTNSKQFTLDCRKSIEDQRFHVLIIGVGVPDADREKLKLQVLSIFASEPPRGFNGPFKADAFKFAQLYEVLGGRVTKEDVEAKLMDIRKSITQMKKKDTLLNRWQNDVVLVYFQGSDGIDAKGKRYLRMTDNEMPNTWTLEEAGLPYDEIGRLAMPGVQLVVLNVPPVPQDMTRSESRNSRYGVMRYANPNKDDTRNPESAVLTGLKTAAEKLKRGDGLGTLGDLLNKAKPELDEKKIKPSELNLDNLKDLPLIKRS
jgi:WD40 repeat protein